MSYSDCTTYSPHKGSLQDLVLGFFVANPDEELSTMDIAEKFVIAPTGSVSDKMAPLVRMQLLNAHRVGRLTHYTAGTKLADLAKSPAPTNRIAAVKQPIRTGHKNPVEIRLTVLVHNAGTPEQRVEVMQ